MQSLGAVTSITIEVQWLMSLFSELGYQSLVTPTIYCENLSATHYLANPFFSFGVKHLALDFHFVREKVQAGSIRVTPIACDDQLVNALTKPLLKHRYDTLMSKIGLLCWSSILRVNIKPDSLSHQ